MLVKGLAGRQPNTEDTHARYYMKTTPMKIMCWSLAFLARSLHYMKTFL